MSISVTGKLNEQAKEFPNQNGTAFVVRIGVKEYDFKNKADVWANYSGFVFAKDKQADFYRNVLVEGAVVELSGSGLIPEVYGDQNRVTLKVQNPRIGYVFSPQNAMTQAAPQQQTATQQASSPQQQPTQTPQQQQPPTGAFDDSDIPF